MFAFKARKVREVTPRPQLEEQPTWLADPTEIVPMWPEVSEQIIFNHTLAVILAQVNGERSLAEITELLAPQMGMTSEQTLPLLRRVLQRSFATRSRSKSF